MFKAIQNLVLSMGDGVETPEVIAGEIGKIIGHMFGNKAKLKYYAELTREEGLSMFKNPKDSWKKSLMLWNESAKVVLGRYSNLKGMKMTIAALVRQKDHILNLMVDRKWVEAAKLLWFVKEAWLTGDYAYKWSETVEALSYRMRETRKGMETTMFYSDSLAAKAVLSQALTELDNASREVQALLNPPDYEE